MYPVFGRRPDNDEHPYVRALQTWLDSSPDQAALAALACNLMCDHRVSVARERHFEAMTGNPRTAKELFFALQDYFHDNVRHHNPPDFINEELNRENILDLRTGENGELNRDTPLSRVLSLSRLLPVFRTAQDDGHPTFSDLPKSDSEYLAWLDDRLQVGIDRLITFLDICLAVIAESTSRVPFEPAWSARWSNIEPLLDEGPDRWNQALGIPDIEDQPEWLIVLRYHARDAGTVCRPTQLDAGCNGYHFPSPPCLTADSGGHPMDLGDTRSPPLLGEFIHPQVPHRLEHWAFDGGYRLGRTSGTPPQSLNAVRKAHYDRLCGAYGHDGVTDWMTRPI